MFSGRKARSESGGEPTRKRDIFLKPFKNFPARSSRSSSPNRLSGSPSVTSVGESSTAATVDPPAKPTGSIFPTSPPTAPPAIPPAAPPAIQTPISSPSPNLIVTPPAKHLAGPADPGSVRTVSLWEKAIKKLSKEDQNAFEFNNPDVLKVLDAVLEAVEEKKEICKKKMWRCQWKGEEVVLRDVADKTITWVKKFKSLGNMVAGADPIHLAIPWAPVRYLLELAIANHEKMGEMLVGVEVITNLIGRCAAYEELYLEPGMPPGGVNRVEEALVSIYAKILTYLITAKNYYAQNTAARIAWSALDESGPLEDLKGIQDQAEQVHIEATIVEANNQRSQNASVKTLLQEFMPKIEESITAIRDGMEATKRGEILNWISDIPFKSHQDYAQDRRSEGTCDWLLERPEFVGWHQSIESSILWLRGDPGAGKTTLTSKVVERILVRELSGQAKAGALAYFYCKRDGTERSNPVEVLRSIVKQLSITSTGPDLQKPLVAKYKAKEAENTTKEKLTIKECILLIGDLVELYHRTTIVIDALDELEYDRITQEDFFGGLMEIVKKPTNVVKLFVSSRYENYIRSMFEDKPTITIDATDNSPDIESYVRTEIERIKEGKTRFGNAGSRRTGFGRLLANNPLLKDLVISKLLDGASGMFMWVEMQINELSRCTFPAAINERLNSLPRTLVETYKEIYQRIKAEGGITSEAAIKSLMWALCSCRPLSSTEFSALVSESCNTTIDMDSLLQHCHNLLKVDTQLDIVRFTHLSVQEFLEKQDTFVLEANIMTATVCLSIVNNLPNVQSKGDYPVLYWPTHLQQCSSQASEHELWNLLREFFGSFTKPSEAYITWIEQIKRISGNYSYGDKSGMEIFRKNLFSPRVEAFVYTPPFAIAVRFGFLEGIERLWDEDWDVEYHYTDSEKTLLYDASYEGHQNVVFKLLEKGAKIGIALYGASIEGHEKVVQMLLNRGAEVNAQGGKYGNALQAASYEGHEKVVQMLLDRGAEVNAQGGSFGNALQAASYGGHEKVVQMLLDRGAEVNAQGGSFGTALRAASYGGHEKVVQMLLNRGAEVHAQGGFYGNALQAASYGGNEKVVQILLDRGAEVNVQGGYYGNALQATSYGGHEKVVQMLLDRGAEVNAQGGKYGNALQAASYEGHEKVVQILLNRGAEANVQGGYYGNALQAASHGGHEKMVQMLLDRGAEANVQGGYYGNALQAASYGGHEKMVQMLLDRGAEVNAQGGKYGNALQAASYEGHEKVVQILLNRGAEANVQGGYYGNALQAASYGGHEKMVQMLLDRGAEVNAQGGKYGNALQAASYEGHEKVVQMLLDRGAEVGRRFAPLDVDTITYIQ